MVTSGARKTADERKELLARAITGALARGGRVESQSDYQAVIVIGKPVNHLLHGILTFITFLFWGIVWIILAVTGGEKREVITVDEYGNVSVSRV